ncbi:hypothetical protein MPH_01105 [Macrophomina phaseolina MS6]|uniref:Transcription factor fungi n=1 Tax=Macrophomina phaseolina (strain MS6) TaxID=1126212 RepID=K2S9N5_MACPH|nr:hypothetical protein MPH_01105 [Macrophomina phaseolina MS6]
MYYAPNGHINADKVLDFYYRYQAWFKELPWEMRMVDEDSTPAHVLMLHMTYHNCVFQLFGILFNIRFTKSDIRPKDICKQAARSVSELLRIYRRNYTLRRSALMMVHILMWTCMTHLHGLPDAESAEIVVQGMEDFKVLADNHPIGLENITIIQEHAEKQKKSLPSEAAQVVAWALDKLSIPEIITEDRESSASSLELPSKGGMNLAEYRPSITAPDLIGTEAPGASLNHPYPASSMVHEAATIGGPSFPASYPIHISHPESSSLHWAPVHDFHHPQAPVAALTAGMLGLSDMLAAHDYERLQRAGFIRAPECERYQPLDPAFYAANDGHRPYMYSDGPQPQYGIRDQAETSKPQMSGSDLGNVPGEYAGRMRDQWYNANRGN